MKKLEIYIAEALGRTSMLPGHSDKRFAKSMSSRELHRVGIAMGRHRHWHRTDRKTARPQHQGLTPGTETSKVQARYTKRPWTSLLNRCGVFS